MWGVPLILMTDQGPANKSAVLAQFCDRLGIEHLKHKPGNARATGSVEKGHDLARMHLETRFRFQDPKSVTLDKLNADGEAWAAAYCSTRIHERHNRTRDGAWMEISRYPGALRAPASLEALQDAASSRPETRRVDTDMRISFGGKKYRLDLVPEVIAGLTVSVRLNVFRAPAVDIEARDRDTGEVSWHVVEPEITNEWGYDGERVIGDGYKGVRNSVLDDNRALLLRRAYSHADGLPTLEEATRARKAHAQAYAGSIDAMADVKATQIPTYLPRHVTELPLASRQVVVARLNIVEACKRVRAKMGAEYPPRCFAYVSERFSDPANPGVPEDQIDSIVSALTDAGEGDAAACAVQGLK